MEITEQESPRVLLEGLFREATEFFSKKRENSDLDRVKKSFELLSRCFSVAFSFKAHFTAIVAKEDVAVMEEMKRTRTWVLQGYAQDEREKFRQMVMPEEKRFAKEMLEYISSFVEFLYREESLLKLEIAVLSLEGKISGMAT